MAEVEEDLWIAVIKQALWDATLGACNQGKTGRKHGQTYTKFDRSFTARDVQEGRNFIKAKNDSLKIICEAIGLNFYDTFESLNIAYQQSMKFLPKEWQDYP